MLPIRLLGPILDLVQDNPVPKHLQLNLLLQVKIHRVQILAKIIQDLQPLVVVVPKPAIINEIVELMYKQPHSIIL
jgi:hypothetical protein